jgi:hypothetical protein
MKQDRDTYPVKIIYIHTQSSLSSHKIVITVTMWIPKPEMPEALVQNGARFAYNLHTPSHVL